MVAVTDYPSKTRLLDTQETLENPPRKRRFRLFSALAAPFRDMDDRALHMKRKQGKSNSSQPHRTLN